MAKPGPGAGRQWKARGWAARWAVGREAGLGLSDGRARRGPCVGKLCEVGRGSRGGPWVARRAVGREAGLGLSDGRARRGPCVGKPCEVGLGNEAGYTGVRWGQPAAQNNADHFGIE